MPRHSSAKRQYPRGPEAFLYLRPALLRPYADHRALLSKMKCDNCHTAAQQCLGAGLLHAGLLTELRGSTLLRPLRLLP